MKKGIIITTALLATLVFKASAQTVEDSLKNEVMMWKDLAVNCSFKSDSLEIETTFWKGEAEFYIELNETKKYLIQGWQNLYYKQKELNERREGE